MKLLGMLPGANKIGRGLKNVQVDENKLGILRAIIRSMTKIRVRTTECQSLVSRKSALPYAV